MLREPERTEPCERLNGRSLTCNSYAKVKGVLSLYVLADPENGGDTAGYTEAGASLNDIMLDETECKKQYLA